MKQSKKIFLYSPSVTSLMIWEASKMTYLFCINKPKNLKINSLLVKMNLSISTEKAELETTKK